MKKNIEYKVIYLNDNEEVFYCDSFISAIILAMASAIQKGRDMRIKYITNENGTRIRDIKLPEFSFSV